jgi:uncharacterized membrane protein YqjE
MRGRAVTLFALGLLLLDGVLLLAAGVMTGRMGPVAGGLVCLLAAAAVAAFWRSHRRRIAELRAAQREVQAEVRALRALITRKDG